MKRLWNCLILLSAAAMCLSLSGCKVGHASNGYPSILHFAYSPQQEQLEGGGLRKDLMRKYLQDHLHMPVEVVTVEGYGPTIEAMRAEKIDLATYGSLAYIIAAQKAGAEAIASYGNPDGSLGGYRSVIAVPKNSPYHTLQDLKAHAKDIDFAFADPASTSGNLYPRVGLQKAGIDPEKDFKKVIFAGGHPAAVLNLIAGKVDAAGFMQSAGNRLITTHKMKDGDVRIIWTSDLIPNSCYAVRKALPEQLKKDIQAAVISIPTSDPALWANLQGLRTSMSISGTQYVPVTDATYDGLRSYTAQVKDFSFVEK
jgi:phosphonate transport system substrate-binding protein